MCWGLLPIFWKKLGFLAPEVVVAHRIVGGAITVALVLLGLHFYKPVRLLQGYGVRAIGMYALSGLLMLINWTLYIWSIANGYLLAASLGYFMVPLLYALVGGIVLQESLTVAKKVAVFFGVLAIIPLLMVSDLLTFGIATGLALSIVFYGMVRKKGTLTGMEGLLVESGVLFVPALIFLMIDTQWVGSGEATSSLLWVLGAGPATVLPLFLYSIAVKGLPFSTVGFMQYISSTLQFLLAIFWFGEALHSATMVSFLFVWLGICSLLVGQFLTVQVKTCKV